MTGLPKPKTGKGKVGACTVECEPEKTARIEIHVGGPYEKGGKPHPYGHVALRVKTVAQDVTYDYGRYGVVRGLGGSEGEGMLRVWTSFGKYINGEKSTGRVTTGYSFEVTEADANKVIDYFNYKIKGKLPNQDRGYMKQYQIEDYDALRSNCTTLSVDGATIGLPSLMDGSEKFNKGIGLSFLEKAAVTGSGWPKRIFMPTDLGNHLSSLTGEQEPVAVTIYKQ